MKKARKTISVMLLFAMILSLFSGFSMPAFAAEFAEDTLVEAEAGNLGPGAVKTKDSDASGGQCIVTANTGEGKIEDPSVVSKPDASYTFNLSSDGTYYVYALYSAENDGVDSFHWWWNDMPHSTKHPGQKVPYQWYEMGSATLKSGKNTLYIVHREFGSKFDAFFVTTNPLNVPYDMAGSGSSPAPSAPADPSAAPTAAPTSAPGTVDVDGAMLYKTKDGSVMFEAEETVINNDVVTILSESGTSNNRVVKLTKANKEGPASDEKPGMAFSIEADISGTYTVWYRYVSTNEGSDSAWFSINGAAYKDTRLPANSKDDNDYQWNKANLGTLSVGDKGSVRIIPRETNSKIDKLIVTNNTSYLPDGMGELPEPIASGGSKVMKLPDNAYPKPSITPPSEHPRVMFRKSDIETIIANFEEPENAKAYAEYKKLLNGTSDGNLEPKTPNNFDGKILAEIEAKALEYALNGNEELGKQAITAIKNYIRTATYEGQGDNTRLKGHVIFTAAEVYDWCHQLLTEDDKKEIVSGSQRIGTQMEIGYPPNKIGAIVGHGSEANLLRDLLALGIATYDEYPDIYNYCAGRLFSEYYPARNFWYPSHTHHQGASYGIYRYTWDLWSGLLIKRMSGEDIYIDDVSQVPYQWIYTRRPDGQMFREGDVYTEKKQFDVYWNDHGSMLFYACALFGDPYLKKELLKQNPSLGSFAYNNVSLTPAEILIFNNPNTGVKHYSELPLTKYFASPLGQMIARTGWNIGLNAPDAVAVMRIGEWWTANHHHLDCGSFQIYYKGILASESGYYESYGTAHDKNYNKESIAHNTLTIFDPSEVMQGGAVNAGGQRRPGSEPRNLDILKSGGYEMGKVLGHEFGPNPYDPEYNYISGDITKAYSAKVSEVLRSMMFMPLDDPDRPAAFVVMDKVTSKPSFKKSFLLHSQSEPEINGNVTIIKNVENGYNGQLTNQTLLPKNAKIEKIGGEGKEFWINGNNYALQQPIGGNTIEAGWGRTEISPSEENKTDFFLNVMYVSDADKNVEVTKADLIETEKLLGAKLQNRAVIFAKDAARLNGEMSFKVEGSDSELKVNVAGLKEGTWSVKVNGSEVAKEIATKVGGIIYFTAPAGEYTLTYIDANATRPAVDYEKPINEGIDIKIGKNYLYSDVPATIINGRTLVPMRAIFEALGAEVTWDEATMTATAVKDDATITITENQTAAYVNGEERTLDVPATIINGRFVVPVRFVSESLGARVDWDALANNVIIIPGAGVVGGAAPIGQNKEGVANIINVTWSGHFEDEVGTKSCDGDPNTLWSVDGDGQWVSYEFDKPTTIDLVYILLNKATERNAYFDLQISEDGKTFTTILECEGDGVSEGQIFKLNEPITTKYFRYYGKGNNLSKWNAIKEIEFRIKK